MENFTIEHTNLGEKNLEKFHNRHVSFDLTYFKTHNKLPLSVNVFCRWVAENISLNLNMLIYFKTSNNQMTECKS